MHYKRVSIFICIFSLISYPIISKAEIEHYLDLEESKISANNLLDNNKNYPMHFTANGGQLYDTSSKNVWIDKAHNREGQNSIGFQLNKNEGRIETLIADIPNNKSKFVSFSVFFPKNYEPPVDWNLFAQWWQGAPASPPISFELKPNTKHLEMQIVTRNGTAEHPNYIVHYNEVLKKNEWIDFTIELKIDDTGGEEGILKVWKNNKRIVNYHGKLGYINLNSHTNFRIGLYRSETNQRRVQAFYDEIKIGNTFREVSLNKLHH